MRCPVVSFAIQWTILFSILYVMHGCTFVYCMNMSLHMQILHACVCDGIYKYIQLFCIRNGTNMWYLIKTSRFSYTAKIKQFSTDFRYRHLKDKVTQTTSIKCPSVNAHAWLRLFIGLNGAQICPSMMIVCFLPLCKQSLGLVLVSGFSPLS